MSVVKNFDLYIKKNFFMMFLVTSFIGMFYYLSQITNNDTIDRFDEALDRYKDVYKNMEDNVNKTKKQFKIFIKQLHILETQHVVKECTKELGTASINTHTLKVTKDTIDLSKPLTVLFDPYIKLTTKENIFSFDYNKDITDSFVQIDILKDLKANKDNFVVSHVCYVVLGFTN